MLLTRGSPTCFQSLALELIQEILLYASHTDEVGTNIERSRITILCCLRLVCSSFKSAVDPFVFKEVRFAFSGLNFNAVIDRLTRLAERKSPACRYGRTLRVSMVDTGQLSAVQAGYYGVLLVRAIKSLQNIRVVHWNLETVDCIYSILDGLSELPDIIEINLVYSGPRETWQVPEMFPLRRFARMESLHITGPSLTREVSNDFVQQLRKILSWKDIPTLKGLHINFPTSGGGVGGKISDMCIIHEIVTDIPHEKYLNLRQLWVHGWTLKVDSITRPHLRSLSYLDVSNMMDKTVDGQVTLWNSIRHGHICLQSITVQDISQSLVQYLLSYTGLEQLVIGQRSFREPFHGGNAGNAHKLMMMLFQDALPHHKTSLKLFHAADRTDTFKCLKFEYAVALQACEKLCDLMITLDANELHLLDLNRNIVTTILQLPLLRKLDLQYSRIPLPYGRRCHCRNAVWYRKCGNELKEVLESLEITNILLKKRDFFKIKTYKDHYMLCHIEAGHLRFQSDRDMRMIRIKERAAEYEIKKLVHRPVV